MREQLRVFVRVRPPTDDEAMRDRAVSVNLPATLGVRGKGKASSYYSATFDGVHDSSSSQAAVYAPLSMAVRSAISGFNSTIVAYGQTGSGKTYTMLGPQATEASHTSTPLALTDSRYL